MKPKTVTGSGGNTASEPYIDASGFGPEAMIMTMNGEIRLDALRSGDRVITRDSGMAVLKSITRTRIQTAMIAIKAGSLGHTRPVRDVCLPAGQPILVRDWRAQAIFGQPAAMVHARALIDGEFITERAPKHAVFFQLVFDSAHVLYVDGLEVGSDPLAVPHAKAA